MVIAVASSNVDIAASTVPTSASVSSTSTFNIPPRVALMHSRPDTRSVPALCRKLLVVSITLVCPAFAADTCEDHPAAIDENHIPLGPKHHPIGRSLPTISEFNQPDRCTGGLWFFDKNGNGTPDPGEVRVFGSKWQVDCSSCHGESAEPKSPTAASVSLRQDPVTLCLVCHRL